ncbi:MULTISPECIES: hypothetical protein [unclassified Mesorhizobium]|uniref:hypothetical protein n=1 Tax=unclassified Mesorhizobium TaxID=325217 RepID=UPI000F75BAD1|nr:MULTISPECIES: hypothetical protein [unclassified Mesorhizobium]AZO59010.1 hypothetical protein EJ078_06615 [Mesorhizobium sp. M1A.F.Ca.IN.022.06.1.1]TGQ22640.1 hypothetical protein EN860_000245 [Mesorhizobium sp. M00.F.Ca.ET.217.01.1.1]TGV85009.1 hypothetical protein EN801_029835 [Mesorhizobium sp. M00.F.Ca.ET.158.01.1.1]
MLDTVQRSKARREFPEAPGEAHPRCLEMAEAMRDLFAVGGGVRLEDLVGAGFTSAEIIEFQDSAARLALLASTKQITIRPDLLADMIEKARHAAPNRPPLPGGAQPTQGLIVAWGQYCAARAALLLDPWSGQRERCISVLSGYLDRLPIFPAIRSSVLTAVEAAMPQVHQ